MLVPTLQVRMQACLIRQWSNNNWRPTNTVKHYLMALYRLQYNDIVRVLVATHVHITIPQKGLG